MLRAVLASGYPATWVSYPWLSVLVAAYIAVGGAFSAVSLFMRPSCSSELAMRADMNDDDLWNFQYHLARLRGEPTLKRLTQKSQRLLECPMDFIVWPFGIWLAVSGRVSRRRPNYYILNPSESWLNANSLAAMLVVVSLCALTAPIPSLRLLAALILLAVATHQLAYLLTGWSLSEALRVGTQNPVATMVKSAASAIATVILGAIVLLRWSPDNRFQVQWLWYETRDVSSLRHVTVLLHNPAPFTVLVGVTTLIVYTTLIAQIRQYRGLQRKEPDRLRTIMELVKIGDLDQGQRLVDRLFNDPPGPQTFDALNVRACVSALSGNLENAWNDQALWFTVKGFTQYPKNLARAGTDDISFRLMKHLSQKGVQDGKFTVELLRVGVLHGASDGCQAVVLRELAATSLKNSTHPGEWKPLLSSIGMNTGRYPMTHLWANVMDQRERAWKDLVRYKTTSPTDESVRLMLLFKNLPLGDYSEEERNRIVNNTCDELIRLSESPWAYWQSWNVAGVLFETLIKYPQYDVCVGRIPPLIRSLISPMTLPFAAEVETLELALNGFLRQPPLGHTRRVRAAQRLVNQGTSHPTAVPIEAGLRPQTSENISVS